MPPQKKSCPRKVRKLSKRHWLYSDGWVRKRSPKRCSSPVGRRVKFSKDPPEVRTYVTPHPFTWQTANRLAKKKKKGTYSR